MTQCRNCGSVAFYSKDAQKPALVEGVLTAVEAGTCNILACCGCGYSAHKVGQLLDPIGDELADLQRDELLGVMVR